MSRQSSGMALRQCRDISPYVVTLAFLEDCRDRDKLCCYRKVVS